MTTDSAAPGAADLDLAERSRRIGVLVHTALLASVGVYAVLLAFFRAEVAAPSNRPPGTGAFLLLAAIGVAQFAGASVVGRRLLRSPRAGKAERVRRYFLLRAAAAEAIAVYGLLLGLLGAAATQVGALFALSVLALWACHPSRASWEEALRHAQSPAS